MKVAAIENIRFKLLAPYIGSIIIIFMGGLWSLNYYQEQEKSAFANEISLEVQHTFTQSLQDDIALIKAISYFVLSDRQLQSSFLKKDRQTLQAQSAPVFRKIFKDYGISHFYFHSIDGTNFLRVHQASRFGDKIERESLRRSMANHKIFAGLEFGTFGQFVLRVVFPWVVDDQLIGYVEIGEEIDDILARLSQRHGHNFLLAVEKDFVLRKGLDKTEFFEARKHLLQEDASRIIIHKTSKNLPEALRHAKSLEKNSSDLFDYEGKSLLLTDIPIDDMAEETVAHLYYLIDVSSHLKRTSQLYRRIVLTIGVTALLLILFYSNYSSKLQRVVRINFNRLKKEIKYKEQTQQQLEDKQAQLEVILEERSHSLEQNKLRYETLFSKTADASFVFENGVFTDCNQAALDLFMFERREDMIGHHPSIVSPEVQYDGQDSKTKADQMIQLALEKGSHRFEWDHMRKNHEIFPAEVLLTTIIFEDKPVIYAVVRDITDRKKDAAKIERQAYYDHLTGLSNRRLLIDRLKQTLITSRRHGYNGALLYIDIDRFKSVNDSLGHTVGDELLQEAAQRIKICISDEDTCSRFSGDEYVVLLRHLGKTDKETASLNAERVASKIQNHFRKPFSISGQTVHLTTSIGIAMYPFENEGFEDVLQHAETAMSSAKDNGRNQIAYYHSRMHDKVSSRLKLEKDLRDAIKDETLSLAYQPQINGNGEVIAVEALARWIHPEHGFVNPEEFIDIAEKSGLIFDLGCFVMKKSITDILGFNLEHKSNIKLAVNISPMQFKREGFVHDLRNMVSKYQLEKDFLTLELTENVAINNLNEAIEKIDALRHIGVRLSLDDFGTGYSSLSHLKRLPIDELKIDKSFVFDIEKDPQDALLVQTIIKIAHQFKLDVVAEGVETIEQLNFLKTEGCDTYQGYYYSKPLSLDDLAVFAEKN